MDQYLIDLLKKELIPAEGCTEPIALAFCAAKAGQALGTLPQKIDVYASGNIIKNVKSVIVPNTGGRKGIEAAAVYGAVAGDPKRGLEVLRDLSPELVRLAEEKCGEPGYVSVNHLETPSKLHILVRVSAGDSSAEAEIRDQHTHLVSLKKNGEVLYSETSFAEASSEQAFQKIELKQIWEFAKSTDLQELDPIIRRQIEYNSRISEEGLKGSYGSCVGKTILEAYGSTVESRCIAKAAAGSDARMSGAEFPVVINSGSGNQGITVSVPVIEYARSRGTDEETLLRALVFSNLTALYQKKEIGRLSAYCGAVSAATAGIAGIAFIDGASFQVIENTVRNALGIVSGIVCDGAKASCAAKIASALQAAFMSYRLARENRNFCAGDGIEKESADETVAAVGEMARNGMVQTDDEIIRIMLA